MSVILVTIDTLRADQLGSYGGKVATPHLDRLAREGALFLQALAHSPLTLPSHSSILTGTYPTYHGVRDNGRFRLPEGIDTLAEILKKAGYATAAFVGGYPVDSRFGLSQGFDHYDERLTRAPATLAFSERRAEEVVTAARNWIQKGQAGLYFAWIHLFDPHAPYDPPEPFRAQYADPYQGEVAYVDHALGELFESAAEEVLMVVTADHGEGLGEHGEATHSLFVYDSTLKVPLIFRGPGVPRGAASGAQVRTIDILPTLLELVGQPGTCTACQGQSLVGLMRGEKPERAPSYAETYFPRLNLGWSELRSLRREDWKYIEAPEPELYDLTSDPGELENLAGKNLKKLHELAGELSKLESVTAGPFASSSNRPPDRETLSLLRSLGYLSAAKPPRAKGLLLDPKSRLGVWQSLHHGMDLVARGEFSQAVLELEDVSKQNPELLLADSYLAGAYFEQGRYDRAAERCGKILAAEPGDFDAALLLGRSLLRVGRLREAEEALLGAARLDPSAADPLAELANLRLKQGATKAAGEALARARECEPDAAAVLLVQGKILMIEGKEKEAESSFRRALARAPSEEEPRVQLGNLLLKQRRLDEAERLFQEGLARRRGSAHLYLGLGHSRALAGRMKGALESFEKALELAPDSPLVLNSLGFAYLETGKPERGLRLLKRSLEREPDQPELKRFLGKLRSR